LNNNIKAYKKMLPVARAELPQLQNSMVKAMEIMFDENLPIAKGGVRPQHVFAAPRVKNGVRNPINGAFTCFVQ